MSALHQTHILTAAIYSLYRR